MSIRKHLASCVGKTSTCSTCGKAGHLTKVCKSNDVNKVVTEEEELPVKKLSISAKDNNEDVYSVNVVSWYRGIARRL